MEIKIRRRGALLLGMVLLTISLSLGVSADQPKDNPDFLEDTLFEIWIGRLYPKLSSVSVLYESKPLTVFIGFREEVWREGPAEWRKIAVRRVVCSILKEQKLETPLLYGLSLEIKMGYQWYINESQETGRIDSCTGKERKPLSRIDIE